VRRVLGHVGGGATILTAQRQTLQHAQGDQDDRRGHANAGVVGQHTHDEGRQTHDQDGDQEGVFAANHVAQTAKHQRAEGTHDEARGKRQQGKNESGARIQASKELLGDDRGERAVQIEVVPLKDGAQGRGEDHLLLFGRHRTGCGGCHVSSLLIEVPDSGT